MRAAALPGGCDYRSASGACVTHNQATLLWILFSVGVALVVIFVVAYLVVQRRVLSRRETDSDRETPPTT